ncbi:hypothetical protein GT022_10715 [Agaribacter marinus]|uniref:Uncharacterized protein n=2 Tax=Virgibacillus TaxID=84406 RepID=A0A941DWP6_9BACI|nr:hypothetical protein [Virgibacillus salarius]MBR7796514.1 hypothetical protein [Virgibacillus salarius]NAZ09223.1 hypothetical protein [Agaribacter marinus]
MEIIDRYIYAVTQRLPQSQRADISQELKGLITDMLEERTDGKRTTDKDAEQVLLELGDPKQLAEQYRETKKYIIGPEFYDPFMTVMKITLYSVVIVMSFEFVIQIIMNPASLLEQFVDYIVSFFTMIPMAIGWVIAVFVLLEYVQVNGQDLNIEKNWTPSDLPQLPDLKRQIKRSEPITAIIFFIIVMAMAVFSSNYFGVWRFETGEFATVVPFLNEDTYSGYMLFILLILNLAIVKEIVKLIKGKWTSKLLIFTVVIDIITVVVVLLMVTGPDFWNPAFMQELEQAGMITERSESYETVEKIWETATLWTLILMIVGLIWNIIAGWLKVRKMNK